MEQPGLLEGPVALGASHQSLEQQRLGFRQLPDGGLHRVRLQRLERSHPLVAVHHRPRATLRGNDDYRHLLAVLRQRRQQPLLSLRRAPSQRLVPQIQLVELDLHRGPCCLSRDRGFRYPAPTCPDCPVDSGPWLLIEDFATPVATWPDSLVPSGGWLRIEDFARSSRPRLPRKSAPTTPNSSCANSHGSRVSGGGTRGGSTASLAFRSPRAFARQAMKYPGCASRHAAWLRRRNSC